MPENRVKYEYYKNRPADWRFTAIAVNGEPVASGEGYKNKGDCLAAIDLLRGSKDAPVVLRRGKNGR